MKKKLVIFDLDGTLLNSIYAIANSVNKALSLHGLKTYEAVEYNNFVGNGLRYLVELIIKQEGYDISVEDIMPDLLRIYEQEYGYNLNAYEGITDLLEHLDKNDIKYAIVTNKDTSLAVKSVEVTEISGFNFTDIIGFDANHPTERKPSPINVERVMNKLNITKEDVLFVGDMIVDYNTAMNAGVDFVYCNWGFGVIKGEEGIDDKYKVNNVKEIIEKYL